MVFENIVYSEFSFIFYVKLWLVKLGHIIHIKKENTRSLVRLKVTLDKILLPHISLLNPNYLMSMLHNI